MVHDPRIDLFENPGDADHDLRPDLEQVVGDGLDVLRVSDRAPLIKISERDHPLENVGQGKKGQGRVGGGKLDDPRDRQDVADEIGVGEDHALGDAGRSAGVNNRGLVVRLNGPGGFLEQAGTSGLQGRAAGLNGGQGKHVGSRGLRLEDHDMLHPRKVPPEGRDFLVLVEVGDDHDLGVAVLDDVLDLVARERRVDRHGDSAEAEVGEIGDRPFRTVLGQDDKLGSRTVPQILQAEGQVPDGGLEFGR